jgi:hypothetical protein
LTAENSQIGAISFAGVQCIDIPHKNVFLIRGLIYRKMGCGLQSPGASREEADAALEQSLRNFQRRNHDECNNANSQFERRNGGFPLHCS